MQLFSGVMVLFGIVIAWSSIDGAHAAGEPFPLQDIMIVIGIWAAAFAMMWLSRRFFNFLAGEDVCHWWFR
jgi:hypothetical protein